MVRLGAIIFISLTVAACSRPPVPHEDRYAKVMEMYDGYRKRCRPTAEISVADLQARREAGERFVLVDIREDKERAVSIIEGAISKVQFEKDRASHKGAKVVVYCTIGLRSCEYGNELHKRGIKAMNLQGSILAWAHAGLPIVTPDGKPTKRVHVYGKRWDLLPDGYTSVW